MTYYKESHTSTKKSFFSKDLSSFCRRDFNQSSCFPGDRTHATTPGWRENIYYRTIMSFIKTLGWTILTCSWDASHSSHWSVWYSPFWGGNKNRDAWFAENNDFPGSMTKAGNDNSDLWAFSETKDSVCWITCGKRHMFTVRIWTKGVSWHRKQQPCDRLLHQTHWCHNTKPYWSSYTVHVGNTKHARWHHVYIMT